jgi:extracellular matrix regulatory protein A
LACKSNFLDLPLKIGLIKPLTQLGRKFVMDIQLINIGFGNIVSANRVVAIVSPESAPIKRIITDARDRGQLIDATYGRRTRAVIITDSSHVILSAIQPETVANRFVISKDSSSSDH